MIHVAKAIESLLLPSGTHPYTMKATYCKHLLLSTHWTFILACALGKPEMPEGG